MRRAARILSVALITAGAVILADVALTLAWKEPVSSLWGSIQQGRLADELDAVEGNFGDERAARPSGVRTRRLAARFESEVEDGQAIGRISIPALDASYVLIEGIGSAALRHGPGRYPSTGWPGQGRTVAIAGHRTTYLAPFRHIDRLAPGDPITLSLPYGDFTYLVTARRIVEPDDVGVVADRGSERLVLTACHPLYSAARRYVVVARPAPRAGSVAPAG